MYNKTISIILLIFVFASCTPSYTVWKIEEKSHDDKGRDDDMPLHEVAYGLTQEFSHVEYNVFNECKDESEYEADTWVAATFPLDSVLPGSAYVGINIIDIYFSQQKYKKTAQIYRNDSDEYDDEITDDNSNGLSIAIVE